MSRIRHIENNNVVWFGSYGKDGNGKAIFWDATYDNNGKLISANSFSSKTEMVRDTLAQKLSIIKNELWWNMEYGLPLIDKANNKLVFDNFVLGVINDNKNIKSILSYTSSKEGHNYRCDFSVETEFGVINLSI